nr:hypothetical protein [uncultured bacterium]
MLPELQIRPKDVGPASLAAQVSTGVDLEQENNKHKVHYLWHPYVDIPLVGPDGIRIRLGKGLKYYGQGDPGGDFGYPIGKRSDATPFARPRPAESRSAESRAQYNKRMADMFLRCVALPVWDISFYESRFNHGKFSDAEWNAGNTLGASIDAEEVQISAGVCAADFLMRYEASHGACVLHPFTGMDDEETRTVDELMKIINPFPYKLTNLLQEKQDGHVSDEETLIFDLADGGPASDRIHGAQLDRQLKQKAQQVRAICYAGVLRALNQARTDWEDLVFQINNTAMGQPNHKKRGSPYDARVAWLLGELLPTALAPKPTGPDPELRESISLLTKIAAGQQPTPAQSGELITVNAGDLQAMIDHAVEQRLAQGNGKKQPPDKGKKDGE